MNRFYLGMFLLLLSVSSVSACISGKSASCNDLPDFWPYHVNKIVAFDRDSGRYFPQFFTAAIRNIGYTTTPAVNASFIISGPTSWTFKVLLPALEPNNTRILLTPRILPYIKCGRYTVRVEADSSNMVSELSETNNVYTGVVRITDNCN